MSEVVDLFCGIGGLSSGFLREGGRVACAVDEDGGVLGLLGSNAGLGRDALRCVQLKAGDDWSQTAQLPPPRDGLHIHASSPCQSLSIAKSGGDEQAGIALFRAALELPLARGDQTWTVEQVPHRKVVALVEAFAAAFPTRVAFAVLDAADFGCPSARRRLIAGDPGTMRAMLEHPARRTSIRDALRASGLAAPEGAVAVGVSRGQEKSSKRRRLSDVAPCVTASHPHTWYDAQGGSLGCLSAEHSAALMGFDVAWALPKNRRAAQRAVGNAIPVPLAAAMARAARRSAKEATEGVAAAIDRARLAAVGAPRVAGRVEVAEVASVSSGSPSRKRDLAAIVDELEQVVAKAASLVREAREAM